MIENLPSNYKKLLIPILEKCFNHEIFNFLNDTKQLKQWLISIVDNLKNTNISDEKFKVYLKYTTEYDQKTNQDSFILNSKLFDILTDEHKDYYRLNKNIKNDHRVRWLGKE
jgi:arginyl-tRNA--protein-N-Asp/Glu arginylyltransferase